MDVVPRVSAWRPTPAAMHIRPLRGREDRFAIAALRFASCPAFAGMTNNKIKCYRVVVLRITIICHNQHLIDIVAIDVVTQLGFGWSGGIISKFLIDCLNTYKILGLGDSVKVVVSVSVVRYARASYLAEMVWFRLITYFATWSSGLL